MPLQIIKMSLKGGATFDNYMINSMTRQLRKRDYFGLIFVNIFRMNLCC